MLTENQSKLLKAFEDSATSSIPASSNAQSQLNLSKLQNQVSLLEQVHHNLVNLAVWADY
jgi:hypothetical protein